MEQIRDAGHRNETSCELLVLVLFSLRFASVTRNSLFDLLPYWLRVNPPSGCTRLPVESQVAREIVLSSVSPFVELYSKPTRGTTIDSPSVAPSGHTFHLPLHGEVSSPSRLRGLMHVITGRRSRLSTYSQRINACSGARARAREIISISGAPSISAIRRKAEEEAAMK